MTLALVLIFIALGIAIFQALSVPQQVTLHWLRLGDLISLSVLGIAVVIAAIDWSPDSALGMPPMLILAIVLLLGFAAHVVVVQLGRRQAQRILIAGLAIVAGAWLCIIPPLGFNDPALPLGLTLGEGSTDQAAQSWTHITLLLVGLAQTLAAMLIGGSIITMMLGHAYLTAGGEMTQQPFLRLSRVLLAVILIRACFAGGATAWHFMHQVDTPTIGGESTIWSSILIMARIGVGIIVPALTMWMSYQCVRIRSNQSATGIMYVSCLMLLIGELTAISLWSETGLPF